MLRRRDVTVLAVAVALAGVLISGRPLAAQTAAPPEPAGRLTVGLSSLGTAEQWLPWLESGREGWLTLDPIYDGLVGVDGKTFEPLPEIAQRWSMEDGGRRWRFHLRSDIAFHGGEGRLTAADVLFSYERLLSDASVSSNKAAVRALVDRAEIVGPHEIVFHLKQVDVTFLGRVSHGNFGVVSKAYVERVGDKEAAAKPIGTGPFRMVEHRRQQSATFEAVPNHWRETSRFKTLVLRRVADQSARLAMLRAGEIDITEIPFRLKREAEATGLRLFRADSAAIYHVQLGGLLLPDRPTFDPKVPWVGDPNDAASRARALKVRQALNLAVDRQAIIRAVFEGEGQPSVAPFLFPGSEFVPKDLQPVRYDPREAKRLLAEAGYPNGFEREIEMLLMPWPGRAEMVDVGEVVAGFWERNLGLKVRRRPIDYATFAPNIGTPRRMAWITWAQGYTPRAMTDPIISMDTWLSSFSRFNTVAETPRIDELSLAVRKEPDAGRRYALYRELAQLFSDNAYAVPIAAVPAIYAYNPKRIASWPFPAGEAYIGGYQLAVPVGRP